MSEKFKISILVGTRPEIIRLSAIIQSIHRSDLFELDLIHSGQNYDFELNEVFFQDFGLPLPNKILDSNINSTCSFIGKMLMSLEDYLILSSPNAFLVLGDTNSCLGIYVAKVLKIPTFHYEAGNRCFDENVPEELNRRIVDTIADVNLCYSEEARGHLISEGHHHQRSIAIGSPMNEVLNNQKEKILSSNILKDLNLKEKGYIIWSYHRTENTSSANKLKSLLQSLLLVYHRFQLPIYFSVHPRTRKGLDTIDKSTELFQSYSRLVEGGQIILSKPVSFSDYNCLQVNSFCVVSDSGTISEESSILGFPAVTIRSSHERPEASKSGSIIFVPSGSPELINAIELARSEKPMAVDAYSKRNVSKTVQSVILSYTRYIDEFIYRKAAE